MSALKATSAAMVRAGIRLGFVRPWLALSPAVVFSRSMAEILPSGTKAFARRC
jgi:hypothetical protein